MQNRMMQDKFTYTLESYFGNTFSNLKPNTQYVFNGNGNITITNIGEGVSLEVYGAGILLLKGKIGANLDVLKRERGNVFIDGDLGNNADFDLHKSELKSNKPLPESTFILARKKNLITEDNTPRVSAFSFLNAGNQVVDGAQELLNGASNYFGIR